ncbi:metal ABC transporter solute-binding protein, Zn/Mn family [Clostridium sp. WILCCON 0269]|uniref:Metal ABC transporter solute-binding protein, Zn/Mn family n=1 Tax=Candidatus Clostridium eludens TaxID=3381663 RepID=A0ABW8SNW4_9CLOT
MFKKYNLFKILLGAFLISSTILMFTGCNDAKTKTTSSKSSSKIKVVVSFNAMAELASAIGKDKIDITEIVPQGTEPHDFEPTIESMKNLSTARVFIYNGLGMESWTDKILKSIDNKNLIVVNASNGSSPIKNTNSGDIKEHGEYDPHLWISLKGAEIQCKNIKDALIKADPSNKKFYEENYNEFSKQLNSLHNEYVEKFNTVKNKNFVTGHAAFAYLCRDYGLKQNSVEDVFAEGEPSAKKLKELVDYCRQNKITTIFMEDTVSAKVSTTLANEIGAKVEKIYTIESKEDNKNYIESMENNLKIIYNSLK